ncbi:MAG TPA: heparinase II/III family protein [Bacteroidales bacterium]|nr:heparinase II/III family protein [Bacteroidales bacterium]
MEKNLKDHLCLIILVLLATTCSCRKEINEEEEPETHFSGILKTLRTDHPRLLLNDSRLDELKTMIKSDSRLASYISKITSKADSEIPKPPIEHVLIGPRLLDKSREALRRIYNLSFAYRWTRNEKYLVSAVNNMKTVCSFADWNPSHFLDVAEMTHAVAIGYDWLYNDMDSESREFIRAGLIKLGLEEGRKAYFTSYPYNWWRTVDHNWNQVCNGGLLIGALAVAESDSTYALSMVPKSIDNLHYALASYAPDGVWPEGPGYWGYATSYTAYAVWALKTALGSTFGLTDYEGMSETGYFPLYTAGPAGYLLNYADAGERSKLGAPSELMWLANAYTNPVFSDFVENQLSSRSPDVWHIIWYRPFPSTAFTAKTDMFLNGKVSLFCSRSEWNNTNALFIGVKAGYNQANHAHLDIGNFEFDALGERWVRDLGSDDYNLPGYFSTGTTGKRWTYYRISSLSHNVPVLGGANQNIYATSHFISTSVDVAEPFGIIDLTEAYKDYASSAKRGVKVVDGKKSVIIQDEFTLSKACNVMSGITTDASITLVTSQKARLTLNGKTLTAKILDPPDASFTVSTAEQAPPQKTNAGVKRLEVLLAGRTGQVRMVLMLSPDWSGESSYSAPVYPLASW